MEQKWTGLWPQKSVTFFSASFNPISFCFKSTFAFFHPSSSTVTILSHLLFASRQSSVQSFLPSNFFFFSLSSSNFQHVLFHGVCRLEEVYGKKSESQQIVQTCHAHVFLHRFFKTLFEDEQQKVPQMWKSQQQLLGTPLPEWERESLVSLFFNNQKNEPKKGFSFRNVEKKLCKKLCFWYLIYESNLYLTIVIDFSLLSCDDSNGFLTILFKIWLLSDFFEKLVNRERIPPRNGWMVESRSSDSGFWIQSDQNKNPSCPPFVVVDYRDKVVGCGVSVMAGWWWH